ncbi:MAG: histidine kinase [Spirochaetia bacterium]
MERERADPPRRASRLSGFMTLKKRIVIIFVVSLFIPSACLTAVSYMTISSLLVNRIQTGIRDNLSQVLLFLENTIRNLNHVSQQLTLSGTVGGMLQEYLANPNPYQRSQLKLNIRKELNLIAFTNPNVGLIMYYFRDGTGSRDLETCPTREGFSPDALPLLARYYGITYFGPHISSDRFSDQYVLSALRKVDMPDRDDVYLYIESGFKLTQSILNSGRSGTSAVHLMLDNDGRVAYSEAPSAFPVNSRFFSTNPGVDGQSSGFYWFRATGNQGWSVVTLVKKGDYEREMMQWKNVIALLFLVFLVASVSLAVLLWRMVYRPLNLFSSEITWIDRGDYGMASIPTRIPEFDFLLWQFQGMKKRIVELLTEVEQKEKRRADLEIENLLFQINPHFLMNSLNTVHWLAMEKGQDEIDRLILAINRLLYHNLGKKAKSTTLGEELESLKEYMLLQKTRYTFDFDVVMRSTDHALETVIPRFILQPLVENALLHGLSEGGHIWLEIESGDRVVITVRDDGPGMSTDLVRSLMEEPAKEDRGRDPGTDGQGMGIGLRYVKRVLEAYYDGRACLQITSVAGSGTSVRLSLPVPAAGASG